MALCAGEFDAGLRWWRTQSGRKHDLHNDLYRKLTAPMAAGRFTDTWWSTVMWPYLYCWRATRRGGTKSAMTDRANARFPQLSALWDESCSTLTDTNITTVRWTSVATFAEVASQIKNTRSPVFVSKFCHFLLPRVFPVTDRRAMGLPFRNYGEHFEAVRAEWTSTPPTIRQHLTDASVAHVGTAIIPGYPTTNKIVELCYIGRRHP